MLSDGTALTVDTLVESVHWDARLSPEDVGYKAVAVSVSDLCAMGAEPTWMLLALSLDDRPGWVGRFAEGVGAATRHWNLPLIGGDTTRSNGPIVVSTTLGGRCVAAPVQRSGARPGDTLWVTGTLGLAGAGWYLTDPPLDALTALRRPDPPVAFALALARAGVVTAMMDLSDGLAADLRRLCAASGVGAAVDPAALPLHPCLARLSDPVPVQVGTGEDYQLLFASPPGAPIEALAAACGVEVTPIGGLRADPEVRLIGRPWPESVFTHFPHREIQP